MAKLELIWRKAGGGEERFELGTDPGAKLAGPVAAALKLPRIAEAVEGGWVITVPKGLEGQLYRDGKGIALATLRAKGLLGKHPQVEHFKLGGLVSAARLRLPDGSELRLRVQEGAATQPPAQPRPTETASAPKAGQKTRPAQRKPAPPGAPPSPGGEGRRDGISPFALILGVMLLVHVAVMVVLGTRDVPEELYSEPTELPERFAKLIIPKPPEEEPEPVEEVGEVGETEAEQEQVEEAEEENEGGGGGGGGEPAGGPQTKEQIREKVRRAGVLAILGAKKSGGGALADVLGEGGLAGLDQSLNQVGAVAVASRGTKIRGKRGGGGGQAADIGSLAAGSGRGLGLGKKTKKRVKTEVKVASFESHGGSLSPDAIRRVVKRNLRAIKRCYEKALAQNPKLQGKVVIKFTIGTNGRITDFGIASSTLGDKDVERCILRRVRRWRFPKPKKGAVTVTYPFIFTATG